MSCKGNYGDVIRRPKVAETYPFLVAHTLYLLINILYFNSELLISQILLNLVSYFNIGKKIALEL